MREMESVVQVMWRGGNWPFLRKEREYSEASIRSAMLCKERSSEPTQNIARTLAFIANLEAKFSGNKGEFRLLSVWRYSDRTRPLFRFKSSAVAHMNPFPILQNNKNSWIEIKNICIRLTSMQKKRKNKEGRDKPGQACCKGRESERMWVTVCGGADWEWRRPNWWRRSRDSLVLREKKKTKKSTYFNRTVFKTLHFFWGSSDFFGSNRLICFYGSTHSILKPEIITQ